MDVVRVVVVIIDGFAEVLIRFVALANIGLQDNTVQASSEVDFPGIVASGEQVHRKPIRHAAMRVLGEAQRLHRPAPVILLKGCVPKWFTNNNSFVFRT